MTAWPALTLHSTREQRRAFYDTAYRYQSDALLEQAMQHCELVLAVARVDAEIEHPKIGRAHV